MIRKLVAHSVKTALAESKPYWLGELFEKGFAGYRNLSRGQLVAELQMHGLSEDKGDADEADGDAFDDLDDGDLDMIFDEASLDLPRAGRMD